MPSNYDMAGIAGMGLPSIPGLGFANPNDPIKAALARMAAQRAQMAAQRAQMAPTSPGGPGAPLPAPGPFAPPVGAGGVPGGPPDGAQGAPQAPSPPRPAPPKAPRPLTSPTQMALMSAGMAVEDAPTLAHAVSRALGAGLTTFREAKAVERSAQARAESLESALADEKIPDSMRNLIRAMETVNPGEGLNLLRDIRREQSKSVALGRDERLVSGTGETLVEAEGPRPEIRGEGGQLYHITYDEDGKPKASALTERKIDPAPATTDIRDFSAMFTPLNLDPNDYQNWPVEAKRAFSAWKNQVETTRGPKSPAEIRSNAIAELMVPTMIKERETALGAARTLPLIYRSLDLVGPNAEKIISGSLANARTELGNLAVTFGVANSNSPLADRVAATQSFVANTAESILRMVEQTGGGLRGVTEKEWETLRNARGNITNNPRAIVDILKALKSANEALVASHNDRVDLLFEDANPVEREFLRVLTPPRSAPAGGAAADHMDWAREFLRNQRGGR